MLCLNEKTPILCLPNRSIIIGFSFFLDLLCCKKRKNLFVCKSSHISFCYKFQNLEIANSLRIGIQWFLSWWRTYMLSLDLSSFCSKITVCLRYADLVLVLPTRVKVLAWPTSQFKKDSISAPSPARLSYAEDALRNMSLPEGIYL